MSNSIEQYQIGARISFHSRRRQLACTTDTADYGHRACCPLNQADFAEFFQGTYSIDTHHESMAAVKSAFSSLRSLFFFAFSFLCMVLLPRDTSDGAPTGNSVHCYSSQQGYLNLYPFATGKMDRMEPSSTVDFARRGKMAAKQGCVNWDPLATFRSVILTHEFQTHRPGDPNLHQHGADNVTKRGNGPASLDVFTDGYENGEEPVVRARIDTMGRKITVSQAWNERDKTDKRLHLNEILEALWEIGGMELSQLRSIEFTMVVNKPTLAAINNIRKRRGLTKNKAFRVKEAATGPMAADWTALFKSPLGKAARRMANEGGNLVDVFDVRGEVLTPVVEIEYLTVRFS
ncbi:Nudix domain-containing protein [Colletotrichum higginsianum IMI 349063]|uniref:Nudix domain-containing protein n=1 Tax=Colletotrichum higginsianum (strain IMI 349063) TaxID=759273 RepID=A0A1B7YBY7_COLHI|nr:Nudix domain-containing protein [Colletotrichum higginsianum IMI 349063]OBR09559.1 Nudix domain-containing protein [Colletotrichum higginsianum IMI 349063]